MQLILPLILVLIIYLHYVTYVNKEHFENKLEYAGQDFAYNNNPRDPNYNYITYLNDTVLVPNPFVYVNKSLYSIDY